MKIGRIPKRFKGRDGRIWVLVAMYNATKPFRVFAPGETTNTSTKYKAMPYTAAREAFDEVSSSEWIWAIPNSDVG